MRRVVLHIGTGKTGTSTLQRALYRARHRLRRTGVDYADLGLEVLDHFGERIPAHYGLFDLLRAGDGAGHAALRGYLARSDAGTTIFSCEDFYHHLDEGAIAALASALSDYRVTVVCYIRRQDEYVDSAYRQRVKVGAAAKPFEEFLLRHTDESFLDSVHANYERMLGPWERQFGLGQIALRLFEPTRFADGDLLRDFLLAAGLGEAPLRLGPRDRSNTALPAELVTVLRAANTWGVVPDTCYPRFVADLRARFEFVDYPLLSPQQRRAVLANYAAANARLFARYGLDGDWTGAAVEDGAASAGELASRPATEALAMFWFGQWCRDRHGPTLQPLPAALARGARDLAFCLRAALHKPVPGQGMLSRRGYLSLLLRMILRGDLSPTFYLECNEDVARAGMDPLVHYLQSGWRERRIAHPGMSERRARLVAARVAAGTHTYSGVCVQ